MKKRKPCGYYWRIKKMMNEKFKDGDLVCIKDFSPTQRKYIIHMAFKHLHRIKFEI